MVAHVITEQTNMMYGRHLDQVILCALYGVCKVNQLRQITFKDIITHYKKQAQAKNSIFRTVAIRLRPDLSVTPPLSTGLSLVIHDASMAEQTCRRRKYPTQRILKSTKTMSPGPLSMIIRSPCAMLSSPPCRAHWRTVPRMRTCQGC